MSIDHDVEIRDVRITALEGALEALLIKLTQNCAECGCQPSIIKSAAERARIVLEDRLDGD